MATTQTSIQPSLRKAGRVFGLRLGNELLEQLKTKASRRGVTVAKHCRSVLLADVQKPVPKTITAAEIYQVALKTLEDVQFLKHTTLQGMLDLLQEQGNTEMVYPPSAADIDRVEEERKTNPNAKAEDRKMKRLQKIQELYNTTDADKSTLAAARLRK